MYQSSHPVSTSINGMGGDMIDGSGTINPAALNTPGSVLPPSSSTTNIAPKSSPRGIKRSRSPEPLGDLAVGGGDDDDQKPRKRGRPPKPRIPGVPESPTSAHSQPQQSTPALPPQHRTPQLQNQGLPNQVPITPTQPSPPKATPTKSVLKALPTVRDHTTDQLNPEGDEYIPREHDEAGEQKVTPTGRPLGGREYKCRTFLVPNRGDKLFMLATECARVLSYRDSYLLFNKNRSLFKIIATQREKDDLIFQEILPYSYRSRQIAIVTAKSMFRQFGSRVILNGRRVRDDYWEAKARKQGFTEEDLAGEKRPGAAKARETASAEAASANAIGLGHPDIIYSNNNGPLDSHGQPQIQPGLPGTMQASLAPLPMILAPSDSQNLRLRDYGDIPRPRQEITGQPYVDRSQSSSAAEIMNQATHTADFSKLLNQQRNIRGKELTGYWNKTRDGPAATSQQAVETSPVVTHAVQSPQIASSGLIGNSQQQMIAQHQASQLMSPPSYSQQSHQGATLAQSPGRLPQSMRPEQLHQRASLSYGSGGVAQGTYAYPHSSQQSWGQPPPQPHQSPLSAHPGMAQYSSSPQSHASHQTQSSHQPPQLQHSQSSGSLHGGLTYQGMPGMGSTNYPSMGARGMYQQSSPSPQQTPQPQHSPQQHQDQQQTTAAQQGSMQGWAPPSQSSHHPGQQGWPGSGY